MNSKNQLFVHSNSSNRATALQPTIITKEMNSVNIALITCSHKHQALKVAEKIVTLVEQLEIYQIQTQSKILQWKLSLTVISLEHLERTIEESMCITSLHPINQWRTICLIFIRVLLTKTHGPMFLAHHSSALTI